MKLYGINQRRKETAMKISNLQFVADGNDLLQYSVDGITNTIPLSAFQKHWAYASSEDIEGGSAYASGAYIVGFVTTASGQGGIVFVWNTATKKLEHISEGAYTIAVLLHDDIVYNLCCVMNYSTPAHFLLCKSAFGTMDAYAEVTIIDHECSYSIDDYNGSYGSVKLLADKGGLFLFANDQRYRVKMTEDS